LEEASPGTEEIITLGVKLQAQQRDNEGIETHPRGAAGATLKKPHPVTAGRG
jgi:hypothetical protein